MSSKIHLSGMEFYAYHGCFSEERQVGTHFKVDVTIEYNATQAAQTDDVSHTVNYQTVYDEIKEIMQHPVNLLETLCQKMLTVIQTKFPQIIHAEVTVSKMNPALGGKVERVALTYGF